jgi:hypothetical protein
MAWGTASPTELELSRKVRGTIEEVRNIAIESLIRPLVRKDLQVLINQLSVTQAYRKVISEDIRDKENRFIFLSTFGLGNVAFHTGNLGDCSLRFAIMDMARDAARLKCLLSHCIDGTVTEWRGGRWTIYMLFLCHGGRSRNL